MQASQSSNALDVLTPDPTPDPSFTRTLPSSFSAPFQAARKYFERQRGDLREAGAREAVSRDNGPAQHGASPRGDEPLAREGKSQNQSSLEKSRDQSREQDRRLERSLYGHSIETALGFDGPRLGEDMEDAVVGPAYLDEGNGSEVLFAYAEPGPLPDPEAVRGAILRLTRESELRGVPAPISARDSLSRESGAREIAPPEQTETIPFGRNASAGRMHEKAAAGAEAAPLLAFRDVARRVWGADYSSQFPFGERAELHQDTATQETVVQETLLQQTAPAMASEPEMATDSRFPQISPEEATRIAAFAATADDAEIAGTLAAADSRSGIQLQPSGMYTASSSEMAATPEAVQELVSEAEAPNPEGLAEAVPSDLASGLANAELTVVDPTLARATKAVGAQEEPALAHDACNLLSALSLYGELLALPGVLGHEHRHYAEELKLMAGRSQVLIDRLLRVAAARKAQGTPFGADPDTSETRQRAPENEKEGTAVAASGTLSVLASASLPAEHSVMMSSAVAPIALVPVAMDPVILDSESTNPIADLTAASEEAALAGDEVDLGKALGTEVAIADIETTAVAATEIAAIEVAGPAGVVHSFAQAEQPAMESQAGIESCETNQATGEATPAVCALEPDRSSETILVSEAAASTAPANVASEGEEAPATSLVNLLMRWASLLSTLAHGTLEVAFGPHAEAPVPAGAEALERILVNLVRNARAATAMGGAIRIGVGVADVRSGADLAVVPDLASQAAGNAASVAIYSPRQTVRLRGTMVLTVDDSGCGMGEAQVRQILREGSGPPFAVRPVSHGQSRRQGLGLQIVRELVAASAGTLSIQSWPGRGTRVEIRWPVDFEPAAEVLEPLPDVAAASQDPIALGLETAEATTEATVEATVEGVAAASEAPSVTVPPCASETLQAATASVEEAPLPGVHTAIVPVTAPVAEPIAGPVLAEADESSSRSLVVQPPRETPRETVGPDGFSAAELRAMMLRLHRNGAQERSPLSRRLSERRSLEARPATRPGGDRQAERGETDQRFGVQSVGVQSVGVPGFGLDGFDAEHPGWSSLAQKEAASKGAIAC